MRVSYVYVRCICCELNVGLELNYGATVASEWKMKVYVEVQKDINSILDSIYKIAWQYNQIQDEENINNIKMVKR